MKSIRLVLLAVVTLSASAVFAQDKTDSFTVHGNCGMCKKRIETAAKLDGVTAAVWNVDTKVMTVTYDPAKTSADAVQKKVAAVGHDTDKYTAEDKVYSKLPGCCLYERKKSEQKTDHSGHKH